MFWLTRTFGKINPKEGDAVAVVGIEEFFLTVKDMEKALAFYHGIPGIRFG